MEKQGEVGDDCDEETGGQERRCRLWESTSSRSSRLRRLLDISVRLRRR